MQDVGDVVYDDVVDVVDVVDDDVVVVDDDVVVVDGEDDASILLLMVIKIFLCCVYFAMRYFMGSFLWCYGVLCCPSLM